MNGGRLQYFNFQCELALSSVIRDPGQGPKEAVTQGSDYRRGLECGSWLWGEPKAQRLPSYPSRSTSRSRRRGSLADLHSTVPRLRQALGPVPLVHYRLPQTTRAGPGALVSFLQISSE